MSNPTREWFRLIGAKAGEPKSTVVHIYDVIGADPFFGGVDVSKLVAQIEALDPDAELDVRINSPGGAAWDGLALADAIMRHPGATTTHIVGVAASAAGVVALASDKVVISRYGQFMLHNARGGLYGTAEELKTAANQLTKLNASMADFYADRAGGEAPAWARAMKAETWYNAEEALAAGLATEVDESTKREEIEAAAAASITKAAAMFKYAGRQAAPGPSAAVTDDGPEGPDTKEALVATSKKVLDALGLPEDADDDAVTAKIAELNKPADPPADKPADKPDPADTVDKGAVEKVAAEAAKLGLAVFDPGTVATMQANAALGVKAFETMETQRVTAVVNAAAQAGKITPAQVPHFVTLMKADEAGTGALLAGIPDHTAVPMAELGHSMPPAAMTGAYDEDVTKDPRYTAWAVE